MSLALAGCDAAAVTVQHDTKNMHEFNPENACPCLQGMADTGSVATFMTAPTEGDQNSPSAHSKGRKTAGPLFTHSLPLEQCGRIRSDAIKRRDDQCDEYVHILVSVGVGSVFWGFCPGTRCARREVACANELELFRLAVSLPGFERH